jgi:hypothetical protein
MSDQPQPQPEKVEVLRHRILKSNMLSKRFKTLQTFDPSPSGIKDAQTMLRLMGCEMPSDNSMRTDFYPTQNTISIQRHFYRDSEPKYAYTLFVGYK